MDFKSRRQRLSNREWQTILSKSNEAHSDALIRQGDFEGAYEHLKRARKTDTPGRENQINMKIVSLPFAEIGHRLTHGLELDNELISDAEAVHGIIGELLAEQLDDFSGRQKGGAAYGTALGNISELTILGLGARHFNRTARSFIVPAAKSQDQAARYASDLRYVELGSNQEYSLQVKTTKHNSHYKAYSDFITLVAMSDIDPRFYRRPNHQKSIAQNLISELNGTYDHNTPHKLNCATDRLFNVIDQQQVS